MGLAGQAYQFTLVRVKNSFPITAPATSLILSFFWNKWTCKILHPWFGKHTCSVRESSAHGHNRGCRRGKVYQRKPFFCRCRGIESRAPAGCPLLIRTVPSFPSYGSQGHQDKWKKMTLYLLTWTEKYPQPDEEQHDFQNMDEVEAVSSISRTVI